MHSYLKLSFKDAKLFPKFDKDDLFLSNFKTTDRSILFGKNAATIERETIPFYGERIVVDHISNVIHVLFGERPVPKNRNVVYPKIDALYNKALDSYLKINNDIKYPHIEMLQLKKALHNSYVKNTYVNWLIIKKYLGADLFNTFIDLLSKNGIDVSKSLESITDEIRQLFSSGNFNSFKDEIMENQKSYIIYYFFGYLDKKTNTIRFENLFSNAKSTRLCVNKTVGKSLNLSGEIIIPVSESDIEIIRKNKGCATILDGGIVSIVGIEYFFNEELALSNGYRKVSDISLKTY